MGRPTCNQSIQHFSHPHPLELYNPQQYQPAYNLHPCAACKLQSIGLIYICKTCNFILHLSCFEKPQFINHPADPNHPLTLLPFLAYPVGAFTCDACGLQGLLLTAENAQLTCTSNCASMPISLNHQAHPHTLRLSICRLSHLTSLNCHICNSEIAVKCRACDFDAHLSCASNPNAQAANKGASFPNINNQPNASVDPLAVQNIVNSINLQGSTNGVKLTSQIPTTSSMKRPTLELLLQGSKAQ